MSDDMKMTTSDFASMYISHGLQVIPDKYKGKNPIWSDWTHKGISDKKTASETFNNHIYNMGILTGKDKGILVFDVDSHDGIDGLGELKKLETVYGKLPETWSTLTGSGGYHFYFKYPDIDTNIKGRANFFIDDTGKRISGIDMRSDGNQVLAEPSIHPDTGKKYEWEIGCSPDDLELASLPDRWIEYILKCNGQSNERNITNFILPDVIQNGDRDNTLWKYAASLRAKKTKALDLINRVRSANVNLCKQPLSDKEIDNIINQVMKYPEGVEPPEIKPGVDPDLEYFHMKNKKGEITGIYDVRIRDYIKKNHPLFIISKLPYIYEGGYYEPDLSGAKLKTQISKLMLPQYIKSTSIKRVYDLFISDEDLQRKYEDVNSYSIKDVCFINGMFDVRRWKLYDHDPKYYSINQIPYDFNPDIELEGKELDLFLNSILPDKDDREMLLEFCGLCFTRDTTQQTFLILLGSGGTGKSTLIRLLIHALGKDNVSCLSLTGLNERFATSGLVGKLLNTCADIETKALEDPATIKKLLGEDTMRGERKGLDSFDFDSYARLLFSANDIPVIKNEKSDGFYRRLLICPMNEKPYHIDPDLSAKLQKCVKRFIWLSMSALKRMYDRGSIIRSSHSVELCKQLRGDSDSVQAFLNEKTENKPYRKTDRGFLFEKYLDYCNEYERKPLTRNGFYKSMRTKGYHETTSNGCRYFDNLALKTCTKSALKNDFYEVADGDPFSTF